MHILKRVVVSVVVGALGFAAINASGVRSPSPAINPKTYVSPSGEFTLHVDPSDLYGRGEATYRVSKRGTVVWTGMRPFTLYDAGITDSGIFGGYAYSHGIEGFPRIRGDDKPGEFSVVALRANGDVILNDVVKRTPSRFLHADPNPVAEGVLVDGTGNRLIVLVNDEDVNRQEHRWWTYELSTGKSLGKLRRGPKVPRTNIARAPQPKPLDLTILPNRPLKQLGSFSLRNNREAVSKSAIRDVMGFDMDDRERIGFIRKEAANQHAFVLLGSDGNVLREETLALPSKILTNGPPKTVWLDGERWLIVISPYGIGAKASAWWLNASTGTTETVPSFESPSISNIVGSRDGGFVALVVTRRQYSMEDALIAFDKSGKKRWEIKQDYSGGTKGLFSPEDLAVTSHGQIAVLDNIRKTIQFFDLNGKFVSVHDLEKSWGREPNYPSEITADKGGGILVKDFEGNPPMVRMDGRCKVEAQFIPKHPDGRVIDVVRGLRVAPSGRIWVSDGECFARLRDDGVADAVIGGAPAVESLGKIAALAVDQRGLLYAADERTGAVHVFDQKGTWVLLCKPNVTDFKNKLSLGQLAVKPDGTIYLNDRFSSRSFVHFAPDGRRLGVKRPGLDQVTEEWHPLPNGEQRLVLGYHDAFIASDEGKLVRTIQRRPDQYWLERPERASVGADGSFAIITDGGYRRKESWVVSVYEPTGEPVRVLALPAACMDRCFTYTGKHLATRTDEEVCVFSATGEPVARFSPSWTDFKSERCEAFATLGGRELWLVSVDRKTVCRFEFP